MNEPKMKWKVLCSTIAKTIVCGDSKWRTNPQPTKRAVNDVPAEGGGFMAWS